LRDSERSAEYAARLAEAALAVVDLARVLVTASLGVTPKLTRLTSAKWPIQKTDFLFT
jgi:hypothetical protein